MARRRGRQAEDSSKIKRHPLLVYYNLGKRYRSPGILLLIMGVLLLLPSFISDIQNDQVDPAVLAASGVVLILVGLAFWLFARLAMHRAYVECAPELLIVRTPFYRVLVSYRRIKQAQPVQVLQIFPKDSLKGIGKPLMTPLLPMTAVEVQVKSWPRSKRWLRRFVSRYLFSERSDGWLFIVPNYSLLIRQLDAAIQRKLEAERGTGSYQDPIQRWQTSSGS
jgi:hypothetical protein